MDPLRNCPLFRGLSESDQRELARMARRKALAKDEHLFLEGEPAPGFYVMERGAVAVYRMNAAGKEQVVHIFRPGESMAEAALLSPTGYPANARAVEPSAVVLIPKAEFLHLLSHRPELVIRMMASMSQHLRVLVAKLDDLTLKNIETRLAHWLIRRCPAPAGDGPVRLRLDRTKRVLASELGTTAETLSRTLAQFRDQGLIEVDGSTITLLRPKGLEEIVRRTLGEV